MKRFLRFMFLLLAPAILPAAGLEVDSCVQQALDRLYNFDFTGAHRILDEHGVDDPGDPVAASVRASAYLFYELDRLMILEAEFFEEDKRIAEKRGLEPDPEVKENLFAALDRSEQLATIRLDANPDDVHALFALCMKEGVLTDYRALVEKKQFGSLSNVKESNRHAVRLLEIEPEFYDAYLTTGLNEYIVGSLPFFVRWFVRMKGVTGSKTEAVRKLELVAAEGRYLGPFAKILLSIISLREAQPERSLELLSELTGDYPENPLIRKELAKVSQKLRTGEIGSRGQALIGGANGVD